MSRERQRFVSVAIANNEAASAAFELSGYYVVNVTTPSAWTAADITFNVDVGTGTFTKVIDSAGAAIKIAGIATNAAETYMLPLAAAGAVTGEWCKIVSTNTASEADVNQGAARTVIVTIAPLS